MNKNITATSNPVMTTNIQLRTKFSTKIPEGLHERFVQIVSKVNSMSEYKALSTLWKLTYNPSETLRSFGLTSDKDYAEDETLPFKGFDFIPEELIIPLRNELRYQRTLVIPNFPEHSVSEKWYEAFEALKNATGQDMITCVIILDKCNNALAYFPDIEIEHSIDLLNNPLDNKLFGGIRNLRFNYDEANYLKPYATHIAALLSAMLEEKKLHSKPNTPMSGLGKLIEEKGFLLEETSAEEATNVVKTASIENVDVIEESCEEDAPAPEENVAESTSPSENVLQITARTILDNMEVLENFLSAFKKLEEVGFNPSEVISKLDAISKNLESIKALG